MDSDRPDRSVEVCREYMRQRCERSENDCRYAHPPSQCHIINGRVTCCVDSIKGRCGREKCRYYHPPARIGEAMLAATSGNRRPQQQQSRSRSPPRSMPSLPPLDRDLGVPGLGAVNPELADILIGYKNALDAALMATRLISGASDGRGSNRGPPPTSSRRTDALEVCRQFLRGTCARKEEDCRYAHPPANVSVGGDNMVTACIDFIKGRCNHDPCRYFHPPEHLKGRVYIAVGGASGGARKRTYGGGGGGSTHTEDRDRRFTEDDDEPPYKRNAYNDVDRRNF